MKKKLTSKQIDFLGVVHRNTTKEMKKKLTSEQTDFLQRVHALTKDTKIMIKPANTYVGGGYIRAITNRILHAGSYSTDDKVKLDLVREWYIETQLNK